MTELRDDSLMSRFDRSGLRCFSARDAIVAVAIAAIVLVLFAGASIRRAGERMSPGPGRTLVRAIGGPAGWVADRLPLADAAHSATAWLSPDKSLDSLPGFDAANAARLGATAAVTADAFDPAALGGAPPARRPLHRLLVTGDSLSTPLDDELARMLAPRHVQVIRDPHLGTGMSKPFVVDWAKLAASQVARVRPDAVVMFVGANEGYAMRSPSGRDVSCCGPQWAAIYANRVRTVADTFRQGGAANVYWITVPTPRDPARQRISRVVNAAVEVGVQPWRAQVRLIRTEPTFTPDGYRDAMPVGGEERIVRQADGIHLNETGAKVLAGMVLTSIRADRDVGP